MIMFAVVKLGSQQFRVEEGDIIEANRIEGDADTITIDQVLLIEKDSEVKVGQPYVKGAKVIAKVNKQSLGKKKIAFKYRRRKDSASKKGHRQKTTLLNITKISG